MCTYSFTRIEEGICVRTRSLAWLITLVCRCRCWRVQHWYSIEFSSFGKINSRKTRGLLLLLLLLLLMLLFSVPCRHCFIVAVVLWGSRPYHKRKDYESSPVSLKDQTTVQQKPRYATGFRTGWIVRTADGCWYCWCFFLWCDEKTERTIGMFIYF